MTAPARFKQSDIKRAFAGAKSAGYERVRVRIDVHGNLVIDAGGDSAPGVGDDGGNEWDVVLPKA